MSLSGLEPRTCLKPSPSLYHSSQALRATSTKIRLFEDFDKSPSWWLWKYFITQPTCVFKSYEKTKRSFYLQRSSKYPIWNMFVRENDPFNITNDNRKKFSLIFRNAKQTSGRNGMGKNNSGKRINIKILRY